MNQLSIYHRGQPILRESLSAMLTIGSCSDNDICLFDAVSPYHARIEVNSQNSRETLLIEKDGPVFMNGQRIAGAKSLEDGDFFDLGAYRFQVMESSAKTATASIREEKGSRSFVIPTIEFLQPFEKKYRRLGLLIGRSDQCDLVVDNSFVSSRHAELFVHEGVYFIRDLHSRNGTYVNDYKVTERPLPPSGTLRLGRATLNYRIEQPPQPEMDVPGIPLPGSSPGSPPRMIVGRSPGLLSLIERLKKIAPSDDTVLLLGETGVGKDLLSQFLHFENPKRKNHPLVIVNCATIPETVADSQLFGHRRGAFTGAVTDHQGFFQQAHRGTLFLDEIGELSLELQAKLLRVMEDRLVRPVGGTREIPIDVRLVCATNRDLDASRFSGRFREDLYERFEWILKVPPLRERRDDIPLLVRYFTMSHAPAPLSISPEALITLQSLPWRGNVRALNRAVRKAITNAVSRGSATLQKEDFEINDGLHTPPQSPFSSGTVAGAELSPSETRRIKRASLPEALKTCQGNITKVAKMLNVSRVTIHHWIKEDGIRATFQ